MSATVALQVDIALSSCSSCFTSSHFPCLVNIQSFMWKKSTLILVILVKSL